MGVVVGGGIHCGVGPRIFTNPSDGAGPTNNLPFLLASRDDDAKNMELFLASARHADGARKKWESFLASRADDAKKIWESLLYIRVPATPKLWGAVSSFACRRRQKHGSRSSVACR